MLFKVVPVMFLKLASLAFAALVLFCLKEEVLRIGFDPLVGSNAKALALPEMTY